MLKVDNIERVTEMTIDKLVTVTPDRDSSDKTATKQFVIT